MNSSLKKKLVLVTYHNPRWLRIYTELYLQGLVDELLDVDPYNFPRKRPIGWQWVRRRYQIVTKFSYLIRDSVNPTVGVSAKHLSNVRDALSSEFFSYFKDPNPEGLLARYYLKTYSRRLREFEILLERFLGEEYCEILVPNGRTGVQRVAVKTAQRLGIKVRYLETGTAHNLVSDRFFLEDYPWHNRVASQEACLAWHSVGGENIEIAREWLGRRLAPNSKVNKFSHGWDIKSGYHAKDQVNVFFNSSTDEYWALGNEWKMHEWVDQYHAFSGVLSKLEDRDPTCENILRLHPNMLNKGSRHVSDELQRILELSRNHPRLRIYWPHEAVNSYELVANAKRIFVSMSTVGLESSLMQKSVWCLFPNHYDLVADIKRIWSEKELSQQDLEPWVVDERGAARVVSFMEKRGVPYEFTSRLNVSPLVRILYVTKHEIIFRLANEIRVRFSRWKARRTLYQAQFKL